LTGGRGFFHSAETSDPILPNLMIPPNLMMTAFKKNAPDFYAADFAAPRIIDSRQLFSREELRFPITK